MLIDWPLETDRHLLRLESEVDQGDRQALLTLAHAAFILSAIAGLTAEPTGESSTFKPIQEPSRHALWRVKHPFAREVFVRGMCWFPPGLGLSVTYLTGDRGERGGLTTPEAAARAGVLIEAWGEDRAGGDPGLSFVRGDEHLARILARPLVAERVARIRATATQADSVFADAAHARRHSASESRDPGAVDLAPRVVHHGDVRLSALLEHLEAAGAENPRLLVTVEGQDVVLDIQEVVDQLPAG